jgi:hypothetical protein
MAPWISHLLLLALLSPSPAQAPGDALERRAKDIAALISADPKWEADLFDAAFVKAVPPDKMRDLVRSYHAQHGAVASTLFVSRESEYSGKLDFVFENGDTMRVTLTVGRTPPNAVVGLWFGLVSPGVPDLAAAADAIGKLPGSASFAAVKLGGKEPVVLAERDPDRALAVGSAFKLYVLGALARDLEEGKRKLEDIAHLDARWRSLPSGKLHQWPLGSPVTLHTLASLMISESDNTATDHLLFTLGRERVEGMLASMGNAAPARNVPFLSTGEMFRMKMTRGGSAGEEFLKREGAARRKFVDEELPKITLDESSVDGSLLTKPRWIDSIEWFASARDMCRAMDWLRKATESGKAEALRGILAINPGVEVSKDKFPYVGYKGGSEPGVLNLTFLLRSKKGEWYALSAGWNDPNAAVEEEKLIGLVTRAITLLARETEAAPEKAK